MSRVVLCLALVALCACQPPRPEATVWRCADGERVTVPGKDGYTVHRAGMPPSTVAEPDVDGCEPKEWSGPWAAARAGGAAFRAVGQEPGWSVEVAPGSAIVLVTDYGMRRFETGPPTRERLDEAWGWFADTPDGVTVLLVVEPLPCFDIMSGEAFPQTATVKVGGTRYSGCGVSFDINL